MRDWDRKVLLDMLLTFKPGSPRHNLLVTACTLAMYSYGDENNFDRDTCLHEIKKRKWMIDQTSIRYLIKHGDGISCRNILTSSIAAFLSDSDFKKAWFKAFRLLKRDDWSMGTLGDVLVGWLYSDGKKSPNQFKSQIDFLVRHANYEVRQFGVKAAMFLRPISRDHLKAVKKGFSHPEWSMRISCSDALSVLFNQTPLSSLTIRILRSIHFREAIREMRRHGSKLLNLRSNADEFEKILDEHGV